ncbi:hypothetical protein BH09BAC2_BH09BAC2_22070 [soil metagenome]
MKKLLLVFLPSVILFACTDKNNPKVDGSETKTTTTTTAVNLPYTVDKTPDWEKGDDGNIATAMTALRGYESNDMNAMKATFADSIEFYGDNFAFKGTRDSLTNILSGWRNGLDSIHIKMHDYESVKSKGRGEEWVSLWYTQTAKNKAGKIDSTSEMDDLRLVNGKITVIDTKSRKLGKK